MVRTVTAAPQDRRYWRRLLRLAHPDSGAGDDDLFVWTNNLRAYVCGDQIEEPPPRAQRAPPKHPKSGERIDFEPAFQIFEDHPTLVAFALEMARSGEMEEPYATLIGMLDDLYPSAPGDVALERSEQAGASFKQLAYIGHLAGFDARQRARWYEIAQETFLSQRCAGHMIARLRHYGGEAA
jgi:hypothetical protein